MHAALVHVVLVPHSYLDSNFVALLVPDANLAAVFLHHPYCAAAAALETAASLGVPTHWESCLSKGSLSSFSASLLSLLVLGVAVFHSVQLGLDLIGSLALALGSHIAIADLLVPLVLEACQS